eukprot:365023-Chlamydomonas_euryale.AAC.23
MRRPTADVDEVGVLQRAARHEVPTRRDALVERLAQPRPPAVLRKVLLGHEIAHRLLLEARLVLGRSAPAIAVHRRRPVVRVAEHYDDQHVRKVEALGGERAGQAAGAQGSGMVPAWSPVEGAHSMN